jgi:hypothetical protein
MRACEHYFGLRREPDRQDGARTGWLSVWASHLLRIQPSAPPQAVVDRAQRVSQLVESRERCDGTLHGAVSSVSIGFDQTDVAKGVTGQQALTESDEKFV